MNIFKRIHAWLNPGHDPVALDTRRQIVPKVSAQRPHVDDTYMNFADHDIAIQLDRLAQYREELKKTTPSIKFPNFKIPAYGRRTRLAQKLESDDLSRVRHLEFVKKVLHDACDVELVRLDYHSWVPNECDDEESGSDISRLTFAAEDDVRKFADYVYDTAYTSSASEYCPGFRDVRAYLPFAIMQDLCIAFNDIPAITVRSNK